MDIAAFRRSPMGSIVPIKGFDSYLNRPYEHVAFVPHPLPVEFSLAQKTYKQVSAAERAIGKLEAVVRQVPNPKVLVRPALYREAISTSALEGTHAPLADVIEADYTAEAQRSNEVREILNAVRATEMGVQQLKERPICQTVLNRLQATLVQGTRSDGAESGRLRTGQVYIGERVNGIEKARYVPPPAGDVLTAGVDAWEKWINADDDVPLIVKIAMGHYQFESLHPYHDGNGRLGRLVITFQLMEAGALTHPVLDVSSWLNPRKDEYKDRLLRASMRGEVDELVGFMAQALAASSEQAIRRADQLLAVREDIARRLKDDGARGVVLDMVDDVVSDTFISASRAAKRHAVTFPPANNAVQRMVKLGILQQFGERSYGRLYYCPAVLSALHDPQNDV